MAKPPTKEEREHMDKVAMMHCMAEGCGNWPVQVHHAETGMGGRKDHMKVLPLCHHHHQGDQGIHTLSRRVWQPIYGYESELLTKVQERL